uniref:SAM domain-containing protein n=1 Tax=Periophthalmus magnuspinnatus TaxID=409849 RepID=A0A3B3ZQC0_9GOBI
MDHQWVCSSWLCEVGLPQYSQVFLTHLVDGRVLNSLNRRDLERYLNISDPFHQTSLLLGVQLLQMLSFDKEALHARRAKCEQLDRDPIVWTCQRVMKWARDIDLKEFADNLQSKGVHGAVLVLDPSFDPEAMSKALCIPTNRHMLHRHLWGRGAGAVPCTPTPAWRSLMSEKPALLFTNCLLLTYFVLLKGLKLLQHVLFPFE